MLKQYKNACFDWIQAAGLTVTDFTGVEEDPRVFVIRYKPANVTFTLINSLTSPHAFQYQYDIYAPGFGENQPEVYPEEHLHYIGFGSVREGFEQWLNNHVRTAIQEELLPDLWATATENLVSPTLTDTEKFTDEERQQAKLALSTFRVLIIEHFNPTEEQIDIISRRLDYLSNAVDRLNKFDWKGVAVSTLFGIVTTLTLDTEKGRQLYGLFQQAFSTLMHLIR